MTRCKFKLTKISRRLDTVTKLDGDGAPLFDAKGYRLTEPGEVWDLEFQPVYHNNDPAHENSRFWAYTPSGELRIGTINKAVVDGMEIGHEYYLDISPASAP